MVYYNVHIHETLYILHYMVCIQLPLSSVIVYNIMPFTYRDLQQSLQHPVRGFPNTYRGQPYVAIAYRQKYIASVTSVSSVYIQIGYKYSTVFVFLYTHMAHTYGDISEMCTPMCIILQYFTHN